MDYNVCQQMTRLFIKFQRKGLRFLSSFYEDWETLNWRSIIENATTHKHPSPTFLELSFRKLSFCPFRPPLHAMYRDLNLLSNLCRKQNASASWTAHEMVQIFDSCSRIGYHHPFLFGDICKAILQRDCVSDMDHTELAKLVSAMGHLGQSAVKTRSIHPCGLFFGISEMLLRIMKDLLKPETLLAYTEMQIGQIWHGLARLRFYDVEYLKPLARETIKPHRLKFIPFQKETISVSQGLQ